MRLTSLAVLSSFALLLGGLGSFSYCEPVKQSSISFSLPYKCTKDERTHTEGLCLADSFKAGLSLVLVGQKGTCKAKTTTNFADHSSAREFTATRMTGTENCLNGEEFDVAIIGVDPSAVHIVEIKNDKSTLSKDMELKARKIASSAYRKIKNRESVPDVADSSPDVSNVGNAAFLLFKSTLLTF